MSPLTTNIIGFVAVGGMYMAMVAFIYYLIVDTKRNLERRYDPYTDSDVDKFITDNSGLMDDLAKGPDGQRD